jgi:hypothetical protein
VKTSGVHWAYNKTLLAKLYRAPSGMIWLPTFTVAVVLQSLKEYPGFANPRSTKGVSAVVVVAI